MGDACGTPKSAGAMAQENLERVSRVYDAVG
jgi:hypothetical protein